MGLSIVIEATKCTDNLACSQLEQFAEDITILLQSATDAYFFGSKVLHGSRYSDIESSREKGCSNCKFWASESVAPGMDSV